MPLSMYITEIMILEDPNLTGLDFKSSEQELTVLTRRIKC